MNILLMIVGGVFLLSAIVGFARGFIKIIASLAATVFTIVIVIVATPVVGNVIREATPVGSYIEEECMKVFLKEGVEGQEALLDAAIPREEQIRLIEESKMPQVIQDLLLENNNGEVYEALGVASFGRYVAAYITKVMTDIVAFLVTFLAVTIIVRTILYVLGIIGDLPVIGGVNRLAGAVLGLGTGLVIVWVLFVLVTLAYDTSIGQQCFAMISENEILQMLYDNNLIMKYIMKF